MPIEKKQIEQEQVKRILDREETQFCDLKSITILPGKLSQTISAFANADGGEIFLGIAEDNNIERTWQGFSSMEHSNSHVQVIEELFPIGSVCALTFLVAGSQKGAVLHLEVYKTPDIRKAANGTPYLRRGAQNLPVDTPEKIRRLELDKGIQSHEDQTVKGDLETITNSLAIIEFIVDIIPSAEPDVWLKKQQLIVNDKPTVAGTLLFSDEPQTDLPKAAIKI